METFLQYAVICPLVMLAGFVDAIAGGGGLISLPGYLLSGLPVHNAIATNKMSSTMGTVLATFKFAKSGFIPWKLSLSCVVCAFAGSSLGANLALLMDAKIFMETLIQSQNQISYGFLYIASSTFSLNSSLFAPSVSSLCIKIQE